MSRTGNASSSSDGVNWKTGFTLNNYLSLWGVSYGNGLYVAVGNKITEDKGAIYTSTTTGDPDLWTDRNVNNTSTLTGVTYGNQKFVAVGESGAILTSSDGVSWTSRNSGTAADLKGVKYLNGKFVSWAVDGTTILTSVDGVSWSVITTSGLICAKCELVNSGVLHSVSYGNGAYVGVGSFNSIYTSSDLVSWTKRYEGTYGSLNGVTYGNGTFIAVGNRGDIFQNIDLPAYTVTYSGNGSTGGTVPTDSNPYTKNATVTVLGNTGSLVKTGNTFAGWNTAANGSGTNYAEGATFSMGAANVTLYAQWTANPTYTVTYNGNGSTGGTVPTDSNSYAQNAAVTVIGNTGSLVKTGSTFAGWNTAANGSGTSYAADATFSMGAANVTLYAQWTADPAYTVTYSGNGSTGGTVPTDSHSYAQNTTVNVLGNTGSLVKTGSTFTGWNTAANGSGTSYAANATFSMGAANVTLYAQWTADPAYTVTYSGNGSTGGTVPTDSHSYAQNAAVTVVGNTGSLVKTGNTFTGWNTAADGTGAPYAANATFDMGAANVTLYAQWTADPTYTVTYSGNGSTGGTVPTDSHSYAQNAAVTVLGNTGSLVKTGNTFMGWNTATNGSGTNYAEGATFSMGAANVTLYAQWTADPTYTVTYSGNGNTGGTVPTDSNSYAQNATVTVVGNTGSLVKTGNSFTGWNTAADGSGTSYAANATFDMGAANVTLYAQWTADPTYTVMYNGNGSTGGTVPTDSHSYAQNAAVTVLGNTGSLVKTGNTFMGWNTAANGTGAPYAANATFDMGAANVTLYAQWTADPTYTVTYSGNGSTGGTVPTDSNSYAQNAAVTVLGNTGSLVKTGNTFMGWNTATDGTGASYAANATFDMGATNVTLYAQWTADPAYTVTYNGNGSTGGTVPTDSNPYAQNATVTVLGNTGSLVKTGNTFTGWNTAADGTGAPYAANATFSMGAANVTLYAQWTANPTYTVTYNGNGSTGGTVPTDSNPYAQNATVTVLGNTGSLEKTGNTFTGWNTAADGTGAPYVANATFSMGAANVTLYAQWTVSPGGGSGDGAGSGGGGSIPTPPENSIVISVNGELSLPAGRMGKVSLGDAITIDIPANAKDKELKLTIKQLTGTQDLLTDEDVLASPIFEILKNFSENFSKPVTLTFKFDPTKLSGNQRAAVFYYDEVQKKWVEVGSVVRGNQITAAVTQFTKFAVMVVGQAASEPKPTIDFSDISAHWAKASINQAVSSGIVTGYQDSTFKPDKTVTRAEFAVMLMNALKTQGAGAALTFTDTAKIGSWAQIAVAQAVQAGIINGYEDGTFRPAGEITRAEMAVIIAGALGKYSEANVTATSFADDKDIPAWAKAAVAYVKQTSIVQGKGDNKFAPEDHATRAEAVTVLLNMLAQKSK
ncbi:InlB B-repeat-containing protein [Paenibacillus rhizoplanae]|uniref:InlB B-repeat-containing protein n=1 Tax=Paenibacillus rhizoplanae TaxID=1917181 RepID=A0ABW5F5R9_9BACL